MKNKIKQYFITKFKVAGFILALFGWLLLAIFVVGPFFLKELEALAQIMQSNYFIWSLRIIILSLVIFLITKKELVQKLLANKKIKTTLKVIYIGGSLGWLLYILTLILL